MTEENQKSQSILKEGSGNLQALGVIAGSAAALAVAYTDPANIEGMAAGAIVAGYSLAENFNYRTELFSKAGNLIKQGLESGSLQALGVIVGSAITLTVAHTDPNDIQGMALGVAVAGASLATNLLLIKDKVAEKYQSIYQGIKDRFEQSSLVSSNLSKLVFGVVAATVVTGAVVSNEASAATVHQQPKIVISGHTPAVALKIENSIMAKVHENASPFATSEDKAEMAMIESMRKNIPGQLSYDARSMIEHGLLRNAVTLDRYDRVIIDRQQIAKNLPESVRIAINNDPRTAKGVEVFSSAIIEQFALKDIDPKIAQKFDRAYALGMPNREMAKTSDLANALHAMEQRQQQNLEQGKAPVVSYNLGQ